MNERNFVQRISSEKSHCGAFGPDADHKFKIQISQLKIWIGNLEFPKLLLVLFCILCVRSLTCKRNVNVPLRVLTSYSYIYTSSGTCNSERRKNSNNVPAVLILHTYSTYNSTTLYGNFFNWKRSTTEQLLVARVILVVSQTLELLLIMGHFDWSLFYSQDKCVSMSAKHHFVKNKVIYISTVS